MKKITIIASIIFCSLLTNKAFAISEVSVDGIYKATIGSSVPFYELPLTCDDGLTCGSDKYAAHSDTWVKYIDGEPIYMPDREVFEKDKTYGMRVCVVAEAGNKFDSENLIFTINGQTAEIESLMSKNTVLCGYYKFIPDPKTKLEIDNWPGYVLSEDETVGIFTFEEEYLAVENMGLWISIDGETWYEPHLREVVEVPVGSTMYMKYETYEYKFHEDSDIYSVKVKTSSDEETEGMGGVDEIENPNTDDSLTRLWIMCIASITGIVICGANIIKSVVNWLYLRGSKTVIQ